MAGSNDRLNAAIGPGGQSRQIVDIDSGAVVGGGTGTAVPARCRWSIVGCCFSKSMSSLKDSTWLTLRNVTLTCDNLRSGVALWRCWQ